jgi:hypothetical protein
MNMRLHAGFFATLIHTSKEVGLEVNTEKTKYMLLSRHQNAGQNQATQRTIHLTTLEDATFRTGSTHTDIS